MKPGTQPPSTAPSDDMSEILTRSDMTKDASMDRTLKLLASRFYRGTNSEFNELVYFRKLVECLFYSPYGTTVHARATAVEEMSSKQAYAIDDFARAMDLSDQQKY